jgi:hypothetical protein
MKMPHFLRLAEIDQQHFITACRHGLVHVTWGRTTLRLSRQEFRELARMLLQATDDLPPISIRSGDLGVAYRADDDCELRIGPLALLVSSAEFEQFAEATQNAVHQLDRILRSGAWDKEEPEDQSSGDALEPVRRNPFSLN